ncbi:hypothetical protein WR25_17795 isoform A [Diploscapter pachys]|uniref:TIL domain-containing protein n=2 Tax=Diploscapter pachys TaxID=2018661 RepID=A0A2A2KMG1_9BILA|nr:hypothetical protein WR25_17795 isoform A [Diploscapter pachys]
MLLYLTLLLSALCLSAERLVNVSSTEAPVNEMPTCKELQCERTNQVCRQSFVGHFFCQEKATCNNVTCPAGQTCDLRVEEDCADDCAMKPICIPLKLSCVNFTCPQGEECRIRNWQTPNIPYCHILNTTCPENEKYTHTTCCELTCQRRELFCDTEICADRPKCTCNKGFYRRKDGKCVKKELCD